MTNNRLLKLFFYMAIFIAIIGTGLVILPTFAQNEKEKLNPEVIENINKFTYIWLSGNSKKYTREQAEFRKIVNKAKKDKDEQSFILGNLYLSMFCYNLGAMPATQVFLEQKNINFHRIHLIYSMLDPEKVNFDIKSLLKKKGLLKDYDYLWIGNYYLLKGNINRAQQYYLKGITQTRQLLKSFDIMMEVAEHYRTDKTKKSFITALPYVRAEDAYFHMTRELMLSGYSMKIVNSNDFSESTVRKYIMKDMFPVFVPGDSAYITMGDLFLLLHSFFIIKGDLEKIKSTSGAEYLPKEYRKIAAYLLDRKMIEPYIDGWLHTESPVSGFYFTKLFEELKKREGLPLLKPDDAFTKIMDAFSLDDYKKTVLSPKKFNIEDAREYLDKNVFPFYIKRRKKHLSAGDAYLFLYTVLILKGREKSVAGKENGISLPKGEADIPALYLEIYGYLIKSGIIKADSAGVINMDAPIITLEFEKLIKRFKEKL